MAICTLHMYWTLWVDGKEWHKCVPKTQFTQGKWGKNATWIFYSATFLEKYISSFQSYLKKRPAEVNKIKISQFQCTSRIKMILKVFFHIYLLLWANMLHSMEIITAQILWFDYFKGLYKRSSAETGLHFHLNDGYNFLKTFL